MSRMLPARPNVEHLRKQAKALLRDYNAGDRRAIELLGNRRPDALQPRIADAQHAVARDYGFSSWSRLKHHVESLVSTDPAIALEAAVRLDDAQRVGDVLARFPSMKSRLDEAMPNAPFGATPLVAAVSQHNREMVALLLDAGANVNQRSHWWAGGFGVLGDDAELNAYLISRGAVIDAHSAARLGMLNRLRELVAQDAEIVRGRFGDGQTPLHVAASVEIAEFLLDRGAEIDALDIDHESTPAQYLVRERPDVVRYLISRGCRTDILMATAVGDADLVHRILEADPGAVWTSVTPQCFPMKDSRAGGTVYIWTLGKFTSAYSIARERGNDRILELVSRYTPPSLALVQAYEAGDAAAIDRLRAEHGEINVGADALLAARIVQAAEVNNTEAVRTMLAAGWLATARNESGVSALHWAAFHGNAEMLTALIQGGADVNARDARFDGTPKGWLEHGVDANGRVSAGNYSKALDALVAAGGA